MSSQKQNQQISLTPYEKEKGLRFFFIKVFLKYLKNYRVLKKILKDDELDTEIFQEKKIEDPKNKNNLQEIPDLNIPPKLKK